MMGLPLQIFTSALNIIFSVVVIWGVVVLSYKGDKSGLPLIFPSLYRFGIFVWTIYQEWNGFDTSLARVWYRLEGLLLMAAVVLIVVGRNYQLRE